MSESSSVDSQSWRLATGMVGALKRRNCIGAPSNVSCQPHGQCLCTRETLAARSEILAEFVTLYVGGDFELQNISRRTVRRTRHDRLGKVCSVQAGSQLLASRQPAHS